MARRFGRPASEAAPAKPAPRVLRADGRKIDLTSRTAGARVTATRQEWQQRAYDYRDMIGELRFAAQLLARSVARCRFYVAEERPWPAEPTPLDGEDHTIDPDLARDAIANFARIPLDTRPDGFTARLVENLELVGEVWVRVDENDRFHVHSVSEIQASAGGEFKLIELPGGGAGASRPIDKEREVLLRLWRPHPEWSQLADAPARAMLDVAEDVVLAGREQRAAARSRLSANGILFVPFGMQPPKSRDDDEGDDPAEETFTSDLTESIVAPVMNDGEAQQIAPIVITADREDIAAVKHLTLTRDDPEKLIDRQAAALGRLLQGLDVQPDQVEGVASASHWSGWLSEAQQIKNQVVPMAEILAACLVQAALRPMLESLGYSGEQLERITIAVDPSPLTENPNRGQDTRDAHDRNLISDEVAAAELGFDADDKPSDEELIRRLAAKGVFPAEINAQIFGLAAPSSPRVVDGEVTTPREISPPAGRMPAASPGETTPANPVPAEPAQDEPSGPIVAAAVVDDGWRVDTDLGLALVEIDAQLADRLQVAADDAIARALEKAGARVKGRANKDRALSASLVGVDAHLVPARLGRARVETFGPISDFLGGEYSRFKGLFRSWLVEAAEKVADLLVAWLGLDSGSDRARRVRSTTVDRLTARIDGAWLRMAATLDEAAARVMFEPDPFNPLPQLAEGEETPRPGTIITPREIEQVLRVAGGGKELPPLPDRGATAHTAPARDATPGPGGFGSGPDVQSILDGEGAVLLGWEWQYRFEIPRKVPFAPWHTGLDKVRFATWTDPKLDTAAATAWIGPFYYPGDHRFCRCRAVPVMAAPELDDESGGDILLRRLQEARQTVRARAASRVAAEDTAAGRVGTSLQNEVEVRDRITDQVERLRAKHIEEHRP